MEINFELHREDLQAANAHLRAGREANRGSNWRAMWIWLGALTFGWYAWVHLAQFAYWRFQPWIWLLTAAAIFGSALWQLIWQRTARATRWLEQFTGSFTLVLTPAGLTSKGPDGRIGFRLWSEIVAFEEAESYLYLYLNRDRAIVVPRAALADGGAAFADRVRTLWDAYAGNPGSALPSAPPAPGTGALGAFWANIRGGVRIAFMRDFGADRFAVSGYHVYRLFVAQLVLAGIVDYVDALPNPAFNIYGLTTFGTGILLAVVGAASIAGLQVQRATMLRLLVMIEAAALVISLISLPLYLGAEHVLPRSTLSYRLTHIIPALWLLFCVFRITARFYRLPWAGAMGYAGLFAFFTLAVASLLPGKQLFYNDEPDNDEAAYYKASRNLNVEDAYYGQAALVQKAIAALAPRSAHKVNLYFVGFAGDGSEKVFSNEVGFARNLLDRRFGTAGHSLVLLNNLEAPADTPLANAHNLDAVLAGIAKRMDRKRDVLFIFLSSHGAQDHRLAVSRWPMRLNDLKAEEVKDMLDRYGIRNRVIVVSACYSGGFLDVLKDDNTLVLTASSRDHVAYGCGDHTRFTFFGDSYFAQALAHGDSFITAFDHARSLVEAREKQEGDDPSRPQIYVGRNIPDVLDKIPVAPVETVLTNVDSQVAATTRFAARLARAHALERQPEVREYMMHSLSPAIGPAVGASMGKCLDQPGANSSGFTVVADIGAGGVLSNLDYAPRTSTAKCFVAHFQNQRFPPPPSGYPTLPVVIDMTAGR